MNSTLIQDRDDASQHSDSEYPDFISGGSGVRISHRPQKKVFCIFSRGLF